MIGFIIMADWEKSNKPQAWFCQCHKKGYIFFSFLRGGAGTSGRKGDDISRARAESHTARCDRKIKRMLRKRSCAFCRGLGCPQQAQRGTVRSRSGDSDIRKEYRYPLLADSRKGKTRHINGEINSVISGWKNVKNFFWKNRKKCPKLSVWRVDLTRKMA